MNEKLNTLRNGIDEIDADLVSLIVRRMKIAEEIGELKRDANLSITDGTREEQVVNRAVSKATETPGGETMSGEITLLMRAVMALSKDRQRRNLLGSDNFLPPPKQPRQNPTCAFAGVPGAWGELALLKCYPDASIIAKDYFDDVFAAVKSGEADYGVVPIENSQSGAIGEVYDLLRGHGCFLVGQTWVDALQCLLAPEGVGLSDIREVLSHPEGFKQCRVFLKGKNWDLTACRNTAVAAKTVAESTNGRTAAIGSRRAAEIYGLNVLSPDIMDAATNRTRFVVIAAEPEYTANSGIISVTFSTAHRSGALCEALLPFMAGGVNLSRIESRPVSVGRYRFFADLQGNIGDARVASALQQAKAACDYFEVLGCFNETE